MKYTFSANSVIGKRDINQDSVLVKHATYGKKEILLAIVCDGVGGLYRGELASGTVIKRFNKWFEQILPIELEALNLNRIKDEWIQILKEINIDLLEYGRKINKKLGTTFTGALFIDNQYIFVHVGDTRLYYIGSNIRQLTKDDTIASKEIEAGLLTYEQSIFDKRNHALFQCIGSSQNIIYQADCLNVEKGIYLLCSDGFRNRLSTKEIFENIYSIKYKKNLKKFNEDMIDLLIKRGEKDNISVIIIESK